MIEFDLKSDKYFKIINSFIKSIDLAGFLILITFYN